MSSSRSSLAEIAATLRLSNGRHAFGGRPTVTGEAPAGMLRGLLEAQSRGANMTWSVSMVDWDTGQPNARFWVLKLLRDNFGPGDKLADSHADGPYVYAQGFVTRDGGRRILLVNKRDRTFIASLSGADGANVTYVDQTTGSQPPASTSLTDNQLTLHGLEVTVVNLSK